MKQRQIFVLPFDFTWRAELVTDMEAKMAG
jgi:hypothetical protein